MNRGFSLVEVAVVLVILGLITGGILAGQALLRAAELRTIGTQANEYATAVQSFRAKYISLPGDLMTATDYWPVNPGGCPAGGGSVGTCNGDGDDKLKLIAAAGTPNRGCEDVEVWRHLTLAGLINGQTETPTYAACYGAMSLGVNIPAARFKTGYWDVMYLVSPLTGAGAGTPAGTFFPANGGNNNLVLGGASSSNHWVTTPSALTAPEAWNIDTKMDDGMPSTGVVNAPRDSSTGGMNCVNEAATGGPAYELNLANSRCTLLFTDVFK